MKHNGSGRTSVVRALIVGAALAASSFGCSKKSAGPTAPVQKGGYLVYAVSVSGPGASDTYDLRISFDEVTGDGVSITSAAKDAKSNQKLTPNLLSTQGSLEFPLPGSASSLAAGMLWLPPDQRKSGLLTKAGTVDRQRKFDKWDVWEIAGRVGSTVGSRFYEVNTGMLVGFTQSSGAIEVGGKLKDSR
jgi:hypothetical protein